MFRRQEKELIQLLIHYGAGKLIHHANAVSSCIVVTSNNNNNNNKLGQTPFILSHNLEIKLILLNGYISECLLAVRSASYLNGIKRKNTAFHKFPIDLFRMLKDMLFSFDTKEEDVEEEEEEEGIFENNLF